MWQACCYSREASAANGRCCLWDVFEEFNDGIAKATVLTCCLFFFFLILRRMGCRSLFFSMFFKFAPLFPFPSAFCRFFLPLLRCFVCSTPFIICVVSIVQQLSVPLQHACCSSCSLSFSISLNPIFFDPCRLFCFVIFSSFVHFFSSSLFFIVLFRVWSTLFCYVFVLGTVALHIFYLNELRLICFSVPQSVTTLFLSL